MIVLSGLQQVQDGINAIVLEELKPTVEALLKEMAADAGDYDKAPLREGQRYRRTGDLGDGWRDGEPLIAISGDTLLAEKTNPVSYSAHVMGAGEQAPAFVDRWRTEEQIMDEWEARINSTIEAAIDAMVTL